MGLFDRLVKPKSVKEAEAGFDIYAPMAGECVSVAEVPDETFAEEILGKGIAIKPADGKVYAPADGEITSIFPTGHAIGMTTAGGVELLIHIGIDTVSLEGRFYTIHAKNGQHVRRGDLLIEADIAEIAKAGYATITPVIVCNSPDYSEVKTVKTGEVTTADVILSCER